MRWFKHMTQSAYDEKLSQLRDEYGLEGYGFWWSIVEIIAAQVDENEQTSVTFSAKKWGNSLGISAKKFRIIAEFCAKIGLIFVKSDEKTITISMPNILKYRDEYTERKAKKSGQNRENVRPSRAFLTETDTETEKETLPLPSLAREGGGAGENADSLPDGQTPRAAGTNPRALGTNPRALGPNPRARGANRRARDAPPSPASNAAADAPGKAETEAGAFRLPDEMGLDFQQFLDAYPPEHREPAGEAVRAWCRLAKARKLPGLPRLLDGIAEWQNSEQWRKDNGRFIPKAANFLKNTMWLSAPPAAASAVPTREQLDAEAARLIDFTAVERRPLWRVTQ